MAQQIIIRSNVGEMFKAVIQRLERKIKEEREQMLKFIQKRRNILQTFKCLSILLTTMIRLDLLFATGGLILSVLLAVYNIGGAGYNFNDKIAGTNNATDLSPGNFGSTNANWYFFWMVSCVLMSFSVSVLLSKNASNENCNPDKAFRSTAIWIIVNIIVIGLLSVLSAVLEKFGYFPFDWKYIFLICCLILYRLAGIGFVTTYSTILKKLNVNFPFNAWYCKFIRVLEPHMVPPWIYDYRKLDLTEMKITLGFHKRTLSVLATVDLVFSVLGFVWMILMTVYLLVAKLNVDKSEDVELNEVKDYFPKDFGFEIYWIYLFMISIFMMVLLVPGILLKNSLEKKCDCEQALRKLSFWIIFNVALNLMAIALGVTGYIIFSWKFALSFFCIILYRLRFMVMVLDCTTIMKMISKNLNINVWFITLTNKLELLVFGEYVGNNVSTEKSD